MADDDAPGIPKFPGIPAGMLTPEQLQQMQQVLDQAQAEIKKDPDAGMIPDLATINLQAMLAASTQAAAQANALHGLPVQDHGFRPAALPDTKTAVLLDYFDPSVGHTSQLAAMFTARGYEARSAKLTLNELRNLAGRSIGVLHIHTHGSYVSAKPRIRLPEQGSDAGATTTIVAAARKFALTTSDSALVTPTDPALVDDIANFRVVAVDAIQRVRLPDGSIQNQPGPPPTVWAATTKFFSHYWAGKQVFARNSLVSFGSCQTFNTSDFQDLRAVLEAAGAGMVVGWTHSVEMDDSVAVSCYLFDRMLGANHPDEEYFPERLPQRPYEWGSIVQNMPLQFSPAPHASGAAPTPLGTSMVGDDADAPVESKWQWDEITGQTQLVPSIMFVSLDEAAGTLEVHGRFGTTPESRGGVTLRETLDDHGAKTQLTVIDWNSMTITCKLPAARPGTSTPGTAGYVVVDVDGRTSNCIPLTEWVGTIEGVAKGDGSLQETGRIQFALRMDAHLYRMTYTTRHLQQCYLSTQLNTMARATPDSTCDYQASGRAEYPRAGGKNATAAVSGAGRIPNGATRESRPVNLAVSEGTDTFDIIFTADKKLDGDAVESHHLRLSVRLPQKAPTSACVDTWVRTEPGGQPVTEQVQALSWLQIGDLTPTDKKTYDLPTLEVKDKKVGDSTSLWKSVSYKLAAETRYPPEPEKGEDYLPIIRKRT